MRYYILCLAVLLQATTAVAQSNIAPLRENFVGVTRLLTNDLIGDGQDRWHTGGYTLSLTYGDTPNDGLPDRPWQLMQYRIRAEILAPENLNLVTAFPDRPYAGVLGIGAFTHFGAGPLKYAVGGELAMVGPSTGLGQLQSSIHDLLNTGRPKMLADQLPDHIYPTVQGEIAYEHFSGNTETLIRPFAEAQAGIETYARLGVDVAFGGGFQKNFFLRDPTTGFLSTNVRHSKEPNFGFILGGDIAYVADSQLLPANRGYTLRSVRPRLRAGMVYEGQSFNLFYGATWLGREFKAQRESQLVGSVRLGFSF